MKLSDLTRALRAAGIDDAAGEARLLFSYVTGTAPALLVGCDPASDDPALAGALMRRVRREPLCYITGEVGFCHETYRVTPDCLIPRADTELIVETAARRLPRGAHFADLCTGSGCIAVSTLTARTDCTADAYDIAEKTLALAAENAARNGVAERIHFHRRDLLTEEIDGVYDAILSNPPYIRDDVLPTLAPELAFEPRIALAGGRDGMDFYRAILTLGAGHLAPGGFFLFEIGYDQKQAILDLAAAHGYRAEVTDDLGGNPRCACLQTTD